MRLPLATRISAIIIGVLLVAITSTAITIGSAFQFQEMLNTVVKDNLESVQAAEELEIALLGQRGQVAFYILDDGNPKWLEELEEHRLDFADWRARAEAAARSDDERRILDELDVKQQAYMEKRREVIALYNAGRIEEAKRVLLNEKADLHKHSYQLCEDFLKVNAELVQGTSARINRQVGRSTVLVTALGVVTVGLSGTLLWLFFHGVIFPLRRMVEDARAAASRPPSENEDEAGDELRILGQSIRALATDVALTRSDLEQSRTQLASMDKLAAVGKLAASVAHEIRNPLTAMKMWLYSLRRATGPHPELQDKLRVIAEEIGRLENIVHYFLEFARPPQLKLAPCNVGRVLDETLQLLTHRLQEQRIQIVGQQTQLPDVLLDREQLKQVFLNVINNALDVMPEGGQLEITTLETELRECRMQKVLIGDTGPGMPADVQARVFEPFFTTKPQGTGLGNCIAAAIMTRHGGTLRLERSDERGTYWSLWLPSEQNGC